MWGDGRSFEGASVVDLPRPILHPPDGRFLPKGNAWCATNSTALTHAIRSRPVPLYSGEQTGDQMRFVRLVVFLGLFIFAVQFPANGQNENEPRFMPSPGPYRVGFTSTNLYDDSRRPTSTTDPASQSTGRRIELMEWYPAETGGKDMGILDYLKFEGTPTEIDWRRRDVPQEMLKAFASSKLAMLAKLDAPVKRKPSPVLVYAPSLSASPIENVDLCEFLASHGYLVLASPSLGAETRLMTDDIDGLKSQARDISFLIDYARSQPNANLRSVAVIGYSWGGLANVYAATQDKRIK